KLSLANRSVTAPTLGAARLQQNGKQMAVFDYNAEAELFPSRDLRGRTLGYPRFARAADAIRFAIEELPAQRLSALGLKSAKSAMTPLEYAAYTSTPIIPWIVRGDKLPIVS